MNKLKPNISFFIVAPSGVGLIVDNAVVFSIERNKYWILSISEREFLLWYTNEVENEGLNFLHVDGPPDLLDMPQEDICKQYMAMLRAKTIPDPEIF